jgi:hypothetical protein
MAAMRNSDVDRNSIQGSDVMHSDLYFVLSLTRGARALFPPATETLLTDSRAVTCCPEDGKLTLEEWVVVVKK